MKKLGVLTFCNTVNYGAELQAYALVKVLNGQPDVSAELIDYNSRAIYDSNRPKSWKEAGSLTQRIKRAAAWNAAKKRWDGFRAFEAQYLPMSGDSYTSQTVSAIADRYDAFVVGSDQIWNLDLTGGDTTFFLPFITETERIFTYAASFGYAEVPPQHSETTRRAIERIDHLLVREESGAALIEALCGKKAQTVLDPTLLLRSDDWRSLIDTEATQINRGKPYILLYLVNADDTDMWRFVEDYAQKHDLDILWITPRRNAKRPGKKLRSAGPKDFLNLICHAHLVVTGSFHAVCFSLQYSKRFLYVMKDPTRATRVTGLLKKLELDSVTFQKGQERLPELDYSAVQARLEQLRLSSLEQIERICHGGK